MLDTRTKWRTSQVAVGVTKLGRFAAAVEDWKKPFRALENTNIIAEDAWHILLNVGRGELKSIYALTDARFRVESVLEPDGVEYLNLLALNEEAAEASSRCLS